MEMMLQVLFHSHFLNTCNKCGGSWFELALLNEQDDDSYIDCEQFEVGFFFD